MTFDQLKAEVVKAGFKVSAWSYEDDSHAVAFSLECWRGDYCGSPKFTAWYSKVTGWAKIGKKEFKIS
jgi:hypothetical protein